NRRQLFGAHVGCGCRERTRLRGNASSPQSYDTRNKRVYPPLLIHVLPKGFHRISLLRTSGQVFLRGKPCTSARTARRTKTASPDGQRRRPPGAAAPRASVSVLWRPHDHHGGLCARLPAVPPTIGNTRPHQNRHLMITAIRFRQRRADLISGWSSTGC